MNKVGFEKWQVLQDEFLGSDLDEKEFCNSKELDLEWFQQQMQEAESFEQQQTENLFVELIPKIPEIPAVSCSNYLKIRFREVDFELADGFSVEVFRQALQVVKEVV